MLMTWKIVATKFSHAHYKYTRKSALALYSSDIELVVRKEDSTSNRRLSSLNFNLSLSLSWSRVPNVKTTMKNHLETPDEQASSKQSPGEQYRAGKQTSDKDY